MKLRMLPVGEQAVLVELESLEATLALHQVLQLAPPTGVQALVPAARTILLEFDAFELTAAALCAWVEQAARTAPDRAAHPGASENQDLIEIPVHYNGEDLGTVAQSLNISSAEVVERHTSHIYHAAFAGFAPGFVYLTGGHPDFDGIPRRASPRARVPAGAVALAGNFSAVYPKEGPGGWQLIGSTPLAMWDLARPEPALIRPGSRVRFVDATRGGGRQVTSLATALAGAQEADETPAAPDAVAFRVVSAGVQTLFQDDGRPGQRERGISRSGVLDRRAFHAANRGVGNPIDCTVLENAMGLLQLQASAASVVCVAGAQVAVDVITATGQRLSCTLNQPIALDPGDRLQLGAVSAGVRCYVAVRGGWRAPAVLQSTAYDTLAGIGPAPLQRGDVLLTGAVAPESLRAVAWDGYETPPLPVLPRPGDRLTLDLLLGPRDDWFGPEAIRLLSGQDWEVTVQSNRIGLRLAGVAPLERAAQYAGQELPSEGTIAGALQAPTNGQPILFLADHPLTGGYPVIGCIAHHHLDLLGQIPAGALIRFNVSRRGRCAGMHGFNQRS